MICRSALAVIIMLILTPMVPESLFSDDTNRIPSKFDPFLQRALSDRTVGSPLRSLVLQPGDDLSYIRQMDDGRVFDVVVFADDEVLDSSHYHFNTRMDGFATARLTLTELHSLARIPGVHYIEKGGEMELQLDRSVPEIKANLVQEGKAYNIPFTGRNTVIGIIDTGIDIFHRDFRDPVDTMKTRIISIWNVSLSPQNNEQSPAGFDYGVEYTREQIEAELRGEAPGSIRAHDTDGHGTHVAGIAGGNGSAASRRYVGVAPEAEFIIVQVPGSGILTSWVIDGMTYIFEASSLLGLPAVVNMSFGGHGGSHDGTSAHELAINQHSVQQGKVIAVAAGNSGESELHNGGMISQGQTTEFIVRVPQYQPEGGNDNDYVLTFLWYEISGTDTLEATVISPGGIEITGKRGDEFIVESDEGAILIDTFDDYSNPKNARVFLIEFFDQDETKPPVSGDWRIRLRNRPQSGPVRYNAWMIASSMNSVTYQPNSGRAYTVTQPGTAEYGITVGSYATRVTWTDIDGNQWQFTNATEERLSPWSGGGPTRDERIKPDISAPGQIIAASKSAHASFPNYLRLSDTGYVYLQGTSMATPHITGVVSLILQANPTLTGVDVQRIVQSAGIGDIRTSIVPNDRWGYGKVNALFAFNVFDITRDVPGEYVLYQNFPNPFNSTTVIRFTVGEPTRGSLIVYDVLGRKVATLHDGALEPRIYYMPLDASLLSSGIYFYRLETERFNEVKKMVVVR
jgi:minor extracellular serine protease Vpr